MPPNLRLLDPLPYIEFLALQRKATVVITDSGGTQEETTFFGIPCLTLRENTERPITVTAGANILVGQELCRVLQGRGKRDACRHYGTATLQNESPELSPD